MPAPDSSIFPHSSGAAGASEPASKMEKPIERRSVTAAQTGQEYVPSSKIRSAADIERAAAGVIDVDAKTTTYVVLACIIAASGGVLFGYDGGTTGKLLVNILRRHASASQALLIASE